jgi:hypothetical protein
LSFPFIIWTSQRTGGTSLIELLMSMSEHKATDHEPFRPLRAFERVTEHCLAAQDRRYIRRLTVASSIWVIALTGRCTRTRTLDPLIKSGPRA